jgi:rRNA maturation protein Nop10
MAYDQGGNCWNCGSALTVLDYGRADTCRKCGRDTKVCKGCQFYDKDAHNQCHETQAERVVDKERSNFCDYFKPGGGRNERCGRSFIWKKEVNSTHERRFK